MEFCPECGAMLLPKDGILKCNSCGHEKNLSDNNDYEVSEDIKESDNVKMLGEDVDVGPITNETCPECGHDKATYKLLQTRSADEAPTRIFTCTKCKHTWRAYDWGFFMKDSKEKEHRISNLKDMINNVKDEEEDNTLDDIEEDKELIKYLNEDREGYEDVEIDDEFIYHPDDDTNNAVNLEENPIDEDFLIKTPKESEKSFNEENVDLNDDNEVITGEISESFDNVLNAKIGRTPIMGVVSTGLGLIFIVMGAITFASRSEKIVDNVISGETTFITVILIVIGLLLLIYGIYKIIGMRNPLEGISKSIDSLDNEDDTPAEKIEEKDQNILPKSNIPLDKDSFKIGEFNFGDLKNTFKKPKSDSKPKTTPPENIDDIPPAREKPPERKGLTTEEIEEIEYEQVKLENESIDEIFAEVEGIEDIPIISVDSKEEGKKE